MHCGMELSIKEVRVEVVNPQNIKDYYYYFLLPAMEMFAAMPAEK